MPKFKIGDKVKVNHPHGFSWEGVIYDLANTGDDEDELWEYWVTNAPSILPGFHDFPLLAWESECVLCV